MVNSQPCCFHLICVNCVIAFGVDDNDWYCILLFM